MSEKRPGLPSTISFVTLGAHDVPGLRAFYAGWGWTEGPGGSPDFAQFLLSNIRLALFRLDLLRDEAAPDCLLPERNDWNGMTLAINVADSQAVDKTFSAAVAAGARAVSQPTTREWGGYSGYVADPEGHRFEIAWLPGFLNP
jgi:hypothetical protein